MGNLLEPGGGVAGVSVGALSGLWRSVYRKAADAAEARLGALLGEHVQQRHGRRALCIALDGGGGVLTAGEKVDVELPWAYALEGWALYADQAGTLVLGLDRSAGLPLGAAPEASYPADLAPICGDGAVPPTLAGEPAARSDDVTGWTTPLARGSVLRVSVVSATAVTVATLTLFVRAL